MSDLPDATAEVVDGKLVISIPLPTLQAGLEGASDWPDDWVITDIEAFARAIAPKVLSEVEEDGSTALNLMLDRAGERAIEDGCDGVVLEDEA